MPVGRRNSLGRFVRTEAPEYEPVYNFHVQKDGALS